MDYTAVKSLMLDASLIARSANKTLEGVLESVANLMVSGFEEDVANLTSSLKALTKERKTPQISNMYNVRIGLDIFTVVFVP